MKRRDLITLLGGAAVTWPLAARAQQPAKPVIGFLNAAWPHEARLRGLREGLKEHGYVEGENLAIEYRWAENQLDRLPVVAAELVRRQVTVIFATGGSAPALAAKAATEIIPIVFAVPEDPLRAALVDSLSRPGGNATGIYFFVADLVAKQLGLLRELVPGAARVAVLVNPVAAARAESTVKEAEAAAVGGVEISQRSRACRTDEPARGMILSEIFAGLSRRSLPSCLEKDFRMHALQKPFRLPDASMLRLLSYSRRIVRL